MSDPALALVDTEDLIDELLNRSHAGVIALCRAREGNPDSSTYVFRGQGNMATKSGLVVMLNEFMAERRAKEWSSDEEINGG